MRAGDSSVAVNVTTAAIHISDLSFKYPGAEDGVFKNFSLTIGQGERFGLFGPNGAGKTTLMNLLTGVLPYSDGRISIFGKELRDHKKEIKNLFGFVPQLHSLFPELSATENLKFFGAWSGLSSSEIQQRSEELLKIMGLENTGNKPVAKFSGGMKNRLNLAIGVIRKPKILFLDEPTTGVDVQTRHAIIQYLKELNEGGTTLVYTSHHLGEAEQLCNRVALMDNGKIIAHDDLSTLLAGYSQGGLEALFLKLTGKSFRDSDV